MLAVAVLSVAGAAYEMIAGSGDAERFPMPGQLVDVGGHRLHLSCLGRGGPTVILDAGLGGTSLDWLLVQTSLSAGTRVCAYDRAGMGWSDSGPEPRSPARIADDLHRLLTNAGEAGPYILVAHSLSGKSARLFAAAYPGELAGMVLVDTRSERIDAATSEAEAETFTTALRRQAILFCLARRLGLVRLFKAVLTDGPALPAAVASRRVMLQTQPQSLRTAVDEGLARSFDDAALTGQSLGNIPLIVIAAEDSMAHIPGWAEAQSGLAALSAQGRLVVAEGSSHMVQIEQPETVVDAVLSVMERADAGG